MSLLGQPHKKLAGSGYRNSKGLPLQTLASIESLSVPLVQEVVVLADVQCAECEKRIADIMARMIETESVVVNVFEKKVTLKGKYSNPASLPSLQLTSAYHGRIPKMATIKRILRSSFL